MQSVDKICRCCLKEDDNLTEFMCKLDIKDYPTILEVFNYATSIESSQEEIDFSRICDACLTEMNTAYNFRKKCANNNEKFQKLLEEFIESHEAIHLDEVITEEPEEEDEVIEMEHEKYNVDDNIKEEYIDESSEEIEGSEYQSQDEDKKLPHFLIENVKQEIEEIEGIDDFEGDSIVTKYLEIQGKQIMASPKEEDSSEANCTCKYCGKVLTNARQCRIHEKRIHQEKIPFEILCDHCEQTFTCRQDLKDHIKKDHEKPENFQCDMCPKQFNNKSSLKNHRNHFHDLIPKQFKCEICMKEFKQKCALSKHYKIHADIRPFPCDMCDKRFRLKHHREQHRRTHTGERPFFCEICGANFSQPETLNQHVKAHIAKAEGIEFKCEFCNKNFTRMKILQEHVKTHTHPHRHECPYCDAKYHHKADLRTHLFSKHLNMTFNCELCHSELKLNERFHRTYSQHVETVHADMNAEDLNDFLEKIKKMRIHEISDDLPDCLKEKSQRINECTVCEINFSTLGDLRNHNLKYHGD